MEIYNLLLSPFLQSPLSSIESIESLKKTIFLNGSKQIGKSISLLQIVDMLLSSQSLNFNVLYVPFLSKWITGYYPFERIKDNLYDQPILSCKILESLFKLNPNLLIEYQNEIIKRQDQREEIKEINKKMTIEEILKDKKGATNLLHHLLSTMTTIKKDGKGNEMENRHDSNFSQSNQQSINLDNQELKENENSKEDIKNQNINNQNENQKIIKKPLIIILDQVNTFWSKTGYFDHKSDPITVDQLLPIKILKDVCIRSDYPVLMALTETKPELVNSATIIENEIENKNKNIFNNNKNENEIKNFFSRDNIQNVDMNGFNVKETELLLRHYKNNGHYYRRANEEFSKLMTFASGGNGERLYEACNYEILYIK